MEINYKQIIIAVVLLIAGLAVGRMCMTPKSDNAQTDLLQARIDSIEVEFSAIETDNERLSKNERAYQSLVDRKNKEIAENDSVYAEKGKWFGRELYRLRFITPEEGTSLLNERYIHVPETLREREILIDLVEGDSSASLLVVALENIKFKDTKIAMMGSLLSNKDSINNNLRRQVIIIREELDIKNAQFADLLKQNKKMKRQRNGLGILAFLALAAGVVF